MKAAEAKRKLCEIRSNLTDDEQKQAIWIAIRAISERYWLCRKL